jgi:hypothetical protein
VKYWECVVVTLATLSMVAIVIAFGWALGYFLPRPWNGISVFSYLVLGIATIIWMEEKRDAK